LNDEPATALIGHRLGELPLEPHTKLFRLLGSRQVKPVGSSQ